MCSFKNYPMGNIEKVGWTVWKWADLIGTQRKLAMNSLFVTFKVDSSFIFPGKMVKTRAHTYIVIFATHNSSSIIASRKSVYWPQKWPVLLKRKMTLTHKKYIINLIVTSSNFIFFRRDFVCLIHVSHNELYFGVIGSHLTVCYMVVCFLYRGNMMTDDQCEESTKSVKCYNQSNDSTFIYECA